MSSPTWLLPLLFVQLFLDILNSWDTTTLRTKFHRPISNNPIVNANKTETIAHKCCTSKSCTSVKDRLRYNIPGPQQWMKLRLLAPHMTKFRSCTALKIVMCRGNQQWYKVRIICRCISHVVVMLKRGTHRHTGHISTQRARLYYKLNVITFKE
jgi:hypothetical protein